MYHIVVSLRGQILVSLGLCKLILFSSTFFINIKIGEYNVVRLYENPFIISIDQLD